MSDRAQDYFEKTFGHEFGHGKPFDRAAFTAAALPPKALPPIIHVAGTNGKGSTIAFLRAIAEATGLSVHAFTKPHLIALSERFLVASQEVDDDTLIAAAREIARLQSSMSQFEAQVATALRLFAGTPADLVLLETGMGGRDDATNIIATPAACVLTPIALDHQEALGATPAEIARHKAGILKSGAPIFVARQTPEVMDVIETEAERIGVSSLSRQGAEWDCYASNGRLLVQTEQEALDLPLPALRGAHQIDNAGLAVVTWVSMGLFPRDDAAIAEAMRRVRWPGRLQPLTRGGLAERAAQRGAELWFDGGHNPHAAAALARALADMNSARPARTALIIGMRARKDWRAFVETVAPCADAIFTVTLPDGASASELAQASGPHARAENSVSDAIDAALSSGAMRILICGSFLLAAEALAAS